MNEPETETNEAQSGVPLKRLVGLVVENHTAEELALGYLRYEMVRRMSPRTFGEMCRLNLTGHFFDDLVDKALLEVKWPNTEVSHER